MVSRVAFVTSGAKGLGYTVVRSLLEAGWDVFFTYGTSVQEAETLLSYAQVQGRRAQAIASNLVDQASVLAAVADCETRFGRIDAFIHNFGPFIFERHPVSDYSDDMWTQMMDGNLTNFLWIYRAVIRGMRQRGFGRIVSVGYDGAGDAAGWRFRASYAAAKSGLAALTRSIAKEERQNGVTANMVCPGDIRGHHKMEMIADVSDVDNPLGRTPVGEDVARLIVYLCGEASQQVSGSITSVTGGYDILSLDDDKEAAPEPRSFAVGDAVWATVWEAPATIVDVRAKPKQYRVYQVSDGQRLADFTAFQLLPAGVLDGDGDPR